MEQQENDNEETSAPRKRSKNDIGTTDELKEFDEIKGKWRFIGVQLQLLAEKSECRGQITRTITKERLDAFTAFYNDSDTSEKLSIMQSSPLMMLLNRESPKKFVVIDGNLRICAMQKSLIANPPNANPRVWLYEVDDSDVFNGIFENSQLLEAPTTKETVQNDIFEKYPGLGVLASRQMMKIDEAKNQSRTKPSEILNLRRRLLGSLGVNHNNCRAKIVAKAHEKLGISVGDTKQEAISILSTFPTDILDIYKNTKSDNIYVMSDVRVLRNVLHHIDNRLVMTRFKELIKTCYERNGLIGVDAFKRELPRLISPHEDGDREAQPPQEKPMEQRKLFPNLPPVKEDEFNRIDISKVVLIENMKAVVKKKHLHGAAGEGRTLR
ncbi:unnamed protein product [Caenorhabditis bovis]|uniref:Uncharacterized protein n=1 Tax=Caenorhabditis bovis TaxID=2654633 RepID=A0A8S1F560_9PELO|nr:unnamed protein product [Caenorhabditis bovis]